ncbi:conserved hypothetical protein, partial [Listeria seeligeri FSL S4-171]
IKEEPVENDYYYVPRKNYNGDRSKGKQILIGVGLFFLDVCLIIPILISLWAISISVWVTVGACLVSPILLGVGLIFGMGYEMYQLFVSIGLVGFGLMLLLVASLLFQFVKKATIGIIQWHKYAVKGGGENA